MTDRSSNLLDNVTPTAFVAPAAPRTPIPHDLPALPGSDLAALRASIGLWDVRIPTAASAPVTVTAEQVRVAVEAIR